MHSRVIAVVALILAAVRACVADSGYGAVLPDTRTTDGGVRHAVVVVAKGGSSATLTYVDAPDAPIALTSVAQTSSLLKFVIPNYGQVQCSTDSVVVANACTLTFAPPSERPAQRVAIADCGNAHDEDILAACQDRTRPMALRAVTGAGAVFYFDAWNMVGASAGVGGVRSQQDERPYFLSAASLDDAFMLSRASGLVTALTVAQLGFIAKTIDVNATLASVFGDADAGFYGSFTLTDLLAHRTGLPDVLADEEMRPFTYVASPDEIAAQRQAYAKLALKKTPAATPGYSSAGYVVVAAAVEKLTSKLFEDIALTQSGVSKLSTGCPRQDGKSTFEHDTLTGVAGHSIKTAYPVAVLPNPGVPCGPLPVLAPALGFTVPARELGQILERISASYWPTVTAYLTTPVKGGDRYTPGFEIGAEEGMFLSGSAELGSTSELWGAAFVVDTKNELATGYAATAGGVTNFLLEGALARRLDLLKKTAALGSKPAPVPTLSALRGAGVSAPLRRIADQIVAEDCGDMSA